MRKTSHAKNPHRLGGWNYADPGWYFVTICTIDRILFFGGIIEQSVLLSHIGGMVDAYWREIPKHFPKIVLDEYIVMPNHLHGILRITEVPDPRVTHRRQTIRRRDRVGRGTLSVAIGGFKAAVTKQIIKTCGDCEESVWQSNFHDRIIRSPESLEQTRQYIRDNPKRWDADPLNPFAAVTPNNDASQIIASGGSAPLARGR